MSKNLIEAALTHFEQLGYKGPVQLIKDELARMRGDTVQEYIEARNAYEAATRPPNSHAQAPVLKHSDPVLLRYHSARAALTAAYTEPASVAGDAVLNRAWAALKSIRYNAENGHQDRPLHMRLSMIATEANKAIAALERNALAQDRASQGAAPVGVERIAEEIRASLRHGATAATRRRWAIELEALAQQPVGGDIHSHEGILK